MENETRKQTSMTLLHAGILASAGPFLILVVAFLSVGEASSAELVRRGLFLLAFLPLAAISCVVGAAMLVAWLFEPKAPDKAMDSAMTEENRVSAQWHENGMLPRLHPVSELV